MKLAKMDHLIFCSSNVTCCINNADFLPPLKTLVEPVSQIAVVLLSSSSSSSFVFLFLFAFMGSLQTNFTGAYCHILHLSLDESNLAEYCLLYILAINCTDTNKLQIIYYLSDQ